MKDFLTTSFWGNTGHNWLWAFGTLIVCFVCVLIFKRVVLKFIKKLTDRTATTLDDFLVEIMEQSLVPLLYISAFYCALHVLSLSANVSKISHVAILVIVTFYVLRIISGFVRRMIHSFIHKHEKTESKEKQARGLIIIINAIVWILGFLFLINNLGYNITSLITGLGIGGIAIALAAQAVLGDLFSYFVIFFDRPFEIGDFIVVDDKMGTIEYIGVKTTRLRTLSGEQLICSNTFLTNSRVHNFKRMQERRIVFKLGVVYETAVDKLKQIPSIVKDIIESEPGLRYDRGNFSALGSYSLDFEFVYYVLNPDYNIYMNIQEQVYLRIFESFEKENIGFAYPTQTILMPQEKLGIHSDLNSDSISR